jgi:hypothetical protein
MGSRETTTLRAGLAGHALREYARRNPEMEAEQHVVQLMADLRILCGRDGLDAGYLFELSEARARSYPAP